MKADELMEHFWDKMWWRMCDVHLSWPVPLAHADLERPFIYDRELGVMDCPSGYHQAAMALLFVISNGHLDALEGAFEEGLPADHSEMADRWLCEKPGRGFRSSVQSVVTSGRPGSISAMERRKFGRKIQYTEEHFDEDNQKNMPRRSQ